jgi:hypothetical protein
MSPDETSDHWEMALLMGLVGLVFIALAIAWVFYDAFIR